MLISLFLVLTVSPQVVNLRPSAETVPPPVVTLLPEECSRGFMRVIVAPERDDTQSDAPPMVRHYRLLERRDERNCPMPIVYPLPDQPTPLGRELGRED